MELYWFFRVFIAVLVLRSRIFVIFILRSRILDDRFTVVMKNGTQNGLDGYPIAGSVFSGFRSSALGNGRVQSVSFPRLFVRMALASGAYRANESL